MPQPPSAASRDEPVIRDRGDACPGALRLHAADDGYLARVRIPGGLLTAAQAFALAGAADRFGDGHLELTSRGNVQLRGLADGCGGALAELLDAAGLLPAPGHERVRNIVATPMAGIGSTGRPDVTPWVGELDRLLCASTRATALSGRFLFALDDGRGDVAALDPDVTVLGIPHGRALLRLGAAAGAVELAAADAPRAAWLAAAYFLDAAEAAGTRAWRVAELPLERALDVGEFAARLGVAGIAGEVRPEVAWPYCPPPRPSGSDAGEQDALCVLPPLGRLASAQWRVLAGAAADGDGGGLRVTPWRSIVLPRAGAHRHAVAGAGLVLAPDDPWESVTACTGRPGCAKSLADVRADARALVQLSRGPLPVHWSGCARRCGHPRGAAWVDATATAGGGYELAVHGRPLPPGTDLAAALTAARNTPSPSEAAVKK
ncbi:cobalamin biosynthesis protein CobG [Streptomyces sp. NBC_00249]|uniref:cobalamin biosynthesis protein CobG n=1 Tax=Streptomyces sp. NBC_00249 TaxID=2975690 RepID=UPI00224FE423|nr:cobalamin biosynthesis protein CobG [Streptomyces sp. NBC_00249]MCX5193637.1 cobalamin biosynthesis protein CobG [Streptomyces sp. NBC_00249]